MLKELNKRVTAARSQCATWKRWSRKLPHNRVARPRIRNGSGQVVGYGDPVPIPEPGLPAPFCAKVVNRWTGIEQAAVVDPGIEAAYRLARRPVATAADVHPLGVPEGVIRAAYEKYCS